jgi:hypothetical protein
LTDWPLPSDQSLVTDDKLFLAADPLMPIRFLAVIALVVVIASFIYVLRHLQKIERMIVADNLVPAQRGPRNNAVLIICAVPIVVMTLLLFLILKA